MSEQDTQSAPAAGTLVIIGTAGSAQFEIAARGLPQPPSRVVALMPFPPAAGTALDQLLQNTEATFLHGLPCERAGELALISHSFPGLVSIAPPLPALTALLPGLRETRRQTVAQVPQADLAALLSDLPTPVAIWIDLPGAEAELLHTLHAAKALEQAEWIELRCGVEPFFVGSEGLAQVEAWLEPLGFQRVGLDDDDPDWPTLRFHADPRMRRIRALEARLAQADFAETQGRRALDELRAVLAAREVDVAALRTAGTSQGKALVERESELAEARAKADALQQAVDEARAIATDRDKALAESRDTVSAHHTALEAASAALAAREKELSEAREKAVALGKTLDEARAVIATRDKALQEARTKGDSDDKALEEARAVISARDKDMIAARANSESKAKALTEAQAMLALRDKEIADAREKGDALGKALDEARAVISARDKDLADIRARAEAQGRSHEEARAALALRDKEVSEAREKGGALGKALDDARATIAVRDKEIADARGKANTVALQLGEATEKLDRESKRVAKLEVDLGKSEEARDKALADAGLALRMQALHQSDLSELRDRFQHSETQRMRVEDLIRNLTPRLKEAAQQLRRLQVADDPAAQAVAGPASAIDPPVIRIPTRKPRVPVGSPRSTPTGKGK